MSSTLFMDRVKRQRARSVVLKRWIAGGTIWPNDEICELDVDGKTEIVRWLPDYTDYGGVWWVYAREGQEVDRDGRILEFSTNVTRGTDPRIAPHRSPFLSGTLLIQAVVETGQRTRDGDIILAVLPIWSEIIRLIERDRNVMFEIDPRKWEEIVAASYERHGFDEVILTPRSGDFGRDIIAVKRGFWSVRVIESVKRYAPGHVVRADDVRALVGVLGSDLNATKAVISTTSDFAPRIGEDPSIKPHVPHRLELINGDQLIARLSSTKRR